AEVGLADAEELLHRCRGEPDLVAAQHATLLDAAGEVETLHRIGLCHIQIRVRLGQRLNRDGVALGVVEQRSGVGQLGGLSGHDCSPDPSSWTATSKTSRAWRSKSSIRSTESPPTSLAMNKPSAPARAYVVISRTLWSSSPGAMSRMIPS